MKIPPVMKTSVKFVGQAQAESNHVAMRSAHDAGYAIYGKLPAAHCTVVATEENAHQLERRSNDSPKGKPSEGKQREQEEDGNGRMLPELPDHNADEHV